MLCSELVYLYITDSTCALAVQPPLPVVPEHEIQPSSDC